MNSIKKFLIELKKKRYHISIYSNDPNEPTRNINLSKKTIFLYSIIFILVFLIFLFLFGSIIPLKFLFKTKSNNEKLVEIESKIKRISAEMLVLQEYNNTLKYVLGDTTQKQNISKKSIDSIINLYSDFELKNGNANSLKTNLNDDISLDIPFSLPTSNYIISQEFDDEENHFGIDFAGKTGDPIYAAADGIVVFSNYTIDYGNTLILVHGNKFLSKYKHNLCNLKPVGSYVHRGEVIALLGNTGRLSSSPHLHFEIWKNGIPKNPLKYLLLKK